jgi:hypothetical protein
MLKLIAKKNGDENVLNNKDYLIERVAYKEEVSVNEVHNIIEELKNCSENACLWTPLLFNRDKPETELFQIYLHQYYGPLVAPKRKFN